MRIDPGTHLIAGINYVASSNMDQRPAECSLDLVIIHNISLPPGEFGGGHVHELFTNSLDSNVHPYFKKIEGLEVSSHLLIERTGKLTQFVPFDKRAWHAGQSDYQGRERCNDFSIGIELEGADDIEYTDQQYRVLSAVTSTLLSTYTSLSSEHIVGHCDVAPQRKTDPGQSFDWQRFNAELSLKS